MASLLPSITPHTRQTLPCAPTSFLTLAPPTSSCETTDALPESSTCSSTLFLPQYARWVS